MRLYHGTNTDFDNIDLAKSMPNKDFGRGFYLSDNYNQAAAMAEIKIARLGGSKTIQEYEIGETVFTSGKLKVKYFTKYDEEWAKFILANRSNDLSTNIHDYDIVVGPIANDRVGLQILRYMEGDIDLDTFIRKLKFMKGLTMQYFFGTNAAISLLHRVK